jgi:Asp/Glu/hydantoin racemase
MPKTLALIHTSMVFINVETMMQDIFKEVMPDVQLINFVDDAMLADVMKTGQISPEVTRRMCAQVVSAETAGADAVFSLCSSLGPTIDTARKLVSIPVIKIDDAMTEKAAREASQIGVMATVPTTLPPTVNLVKEKASQLDKQVEIREALVKGAFEKLMAGDKEGHDSMVSATAKELSRQVEIIVLAQASMTRLAPRLQQETGLPVLSSPQLGIEYAKRVLDELAQ